MSDHVLVIDMGGAGGDQRLADVPELRIIDRGQGPAAGIAGSLTGNIVDTWQVPLEDAGPSGADAGKGGKYLLLPGVG